MCVERPEAGRALAGTRAGARSSVGDSGTDEPYWSELTCRQVVGHARLMLDCDLAFPVILSSDGRVMDGMHRICRALFEGLGEVEAVRFIEDPEPDYIGVDPDDLPD